MKILFIILILFTACTSQKEKIVERQKEIKREIIETQKEEEIKSQKRFDADTISKIKINLTLTSDKEIQLKREYDSLEFELKKY